MRPDVQKIVAATARGKKRTEGYPDEGGTLHHAERQLFGALRHVERMRAQKSEEQEVRQAEIQCQQAYDRFAEVAAWYIDNLTSRYSNEHPSSGKGDVLNAAHGTLLAHLLCGELRTDQFWQDVWSVQ